MTSDPKHRPPACGAVSPNGFVCTRDAGHERFYHQNGHGMIWSPEPDDTGTQSSPRIVPCLCPSADIGVHRTQCEFHRSRSGTQSSAEPSFARCGYCGAGTARLICQSADQCKEPRCAHGADKDQCIACCPVADEPSQAPEFTVRRSTLPPIVHRHWPDTTDASGCVECLREQVMLYQTKPAYDEGYDMGQRSASNEIERLREQVLRLTETCRRLRNQLATTEGKGPRRDY